VNLAAVILSGGNREALIADAIKSADAFVDAFVLIDTGESAAKAIAVAREILGDRCIVHRFSEPFDCARARNFGLDCAAADGFDFAMQLDTDERMRVADPSIVKRMLSMVETETVLCENDGHCYKKNRFFRLPREGRWDGVVHEGYLTQGATLARGITFSEVEKTPDEEFARQIWIAAKCSEALKSDPNNARYHYYLADALDATDDPIGAVAEFLRAAELSDWDEEVDWSHYKAAMIRYAMGDIGQALSITLASSLRTPELLWAASLFALELGALPRSEELASRAVSAAEEQREHDRQGFTYKFAWYEGPHDILWRIAVANGNAELEAAHAAKVIELHSERIRRLVA
jgi:glycosyltransferase involved in cell wall biosynthesis